MGEEIRYSHFNHHDFHRFERFLKQETEMLASWEREGKLSRRRAVGGLELEMWIVDDQGNPQAVNQSLIAKAGSKDVVAELSQFNVEFNVEPQPLSGRGIEWLAQELEATWKVCQSAAQSLGVSTVAIGTLPTIHDAQLSLSSITPSERYRALNEQAMRLRQGRPFRLRIQGLDQLDTLHHDVVLEAGATSLQIHLQVAFDEAPAYYNASQLVSAPLIAVSANAPFLFGKRLWDETRIALFEQAVDVGRSSLRRVSFGSGYAKESLLECFEENLALFPIMLPLARTEADDHLPHLRLHNGTIWRWNRPLVGFDPDGTCHFRIEQRVPSAGPTVIDMAANLAFYFGLVEAVARRLLNSEPSIAAEVARENFYAAAQLGFNASLTWSGGWRGPMKEFLNRFALPLAREGLAHLQVDDELSEQWLAMIANRISTGQQGATWQRSFFEAHAGDFGLLVREYMARQIDGQPVHTWDLG